MASSSSMGLKLVIVMVLCMVLMGALPLAQGAITCGQVTTSLTACISYAQGGPVPAACCTGLRSLDAAATTTADRQQACNCIASSLGSGLIGNVGVLAAQSSACGVSIPVQISASGSVDCTSLT